ncbi:VanZ family protein [Soonwooa sp.]|uniref:VanZ family protein n=1 Tax=Soonwooa sp. TaxID=1938592 RepID=UPI002631CDF5|nr:VanZ family protein [Soonwooa sp.]
MPIYWAFLTYMLLRPGLENKEYSFMFPGFDKVLHFSIFGFLGFCLLVSFPNLKRSTYLLIGFAYALLTEILQETMGFGRSLEVLDVVADMLGFSLAILVYKIICKYLPN